MDTIRLLSRNRIALLFAITLFLLVVYGMTIMMLGGQTPHSIKNRLDEARADPAELQQHREQWVSANITHYQVAVETLGYPDAYICPSTTIEVENNAYKGLVGAPPTDQGWSSACESIYFLLTVDRLFELAEQFLIVNDPIRILTYEVEFDEELGYISSLQVVTSSIPLDIFVPGEHPHGFFQISATDLEVLDEGQQG